MTFEDTLKSVTDLMIDSFDRETVEKNAEAFEKMKTLYAADPHGFLDQVQFAQENFHTLLRHVMQIPESDDSYILEHIASGLYKHYHTERIEQLEGSSCSYDKSSFIESKTMQAIRQGINLSLFADYQNVEQIKKDKHRKAYWSPTSVKDTDEAMELFWQWYRVRT